MKTENKIIEFKAPEGMEIEFIEIDSNDYTRGRISLREKVKEYPNSWEEYLIKSCEEEGFGAEVARKLEKGNTFIYATKEQTKAEKALKKLTRLIACYNEGWKPDFFGERKNSIKYCIIIYRDYNKHSMLLEVSNHKKSPTLLCFESYKIAGLFLDNFRDLIKEASPLLFGYTFKD